MTTATVSGNSGSPRKGLRPGIIFRLSVRNVLRYARRSTLTASAMVLGLALLIFSRTIADGAHEGWIDQAFNWVLGMSPCKPPAFSRATPSTTAWRETLWRPPCGPSTPRRSERWS